MAEAPSARPKNTRRYGKTRADAAVPIEDRLAALDDTGPRDLSPRHSPKHATSPPPSPGSDVGFAYGWKARLAAIDAGKEDDSLLSLDDEPQPFPLSSPTAASSTRTPYNKRVQSSKSASSSPVSPLPSPLDVSPSLLGSTLPRKRSHDEGDGHIIAAPTLYSVSPSLPNVLSSIDATPKDIGISGDSDSHQSHDEAPKKSKKGKKPKKLTKKEAIETQKESARLKAAKNVSLRGSGFVPKARPISNLLEILHQSVAPQRPVSSPIDSFSSPRPSNPPSTDPSGFQNQPSSATLVAPSDKVTPSIWKADYNEQAPSSPYEPPPPTFPSHHVPSFLTSSKFHDHAPALCPPSPDDDDGDDDDILHPDVLVARGIAESKESAKEKENLARARALKMQALELQGAKNVITSTGAFSGAASEEDDLEFDVTRGPTAAHINEEKSKGHQPQPFLDDTISRVTKPRARGVARADPFGPVVIAKQAQAMRKPKAKDPLGEHREKLLAMAGLNATETRKAKEADWVARGGTLKDAQAPKGPMLEEILEKGTEKNRELELRLGRGEFDSGDEDQEDGDYQPHEESDREQDGFSQPLRPPEPAGFSALLSPSSSSESHASGSSPLFQRTAPVDGSPSHTSPPTSTSEDDADHGTYDVSSLAQRRRAKKRLVRRVVSDDEDEGSENAPPRPPGSGADSDAENARPVMDDSDLENIPPPVVQQVSTGLDDDGIAIGGRGPLKPLSSFSSSLSLSSMSQVFEKPLGALSESGKRSFSSESPRCGPLAELREPARQADENVGEADFGFGGMSQLFEATQGIPSQIKPLRDGLVGGTEFNLSLSTQASALLPAVKISDSRRRMNDNILMQQEEDIGLAMQEQTSSPLNDGKELFLNEDGFLTQTVSPSWNQPVFATRNEFEPSPEIRSNQNQSKVGSLRWNERDDSLSPVAGASPRRRLVGGSVLSPSLSRPLSTSPMSDPASRVVTVTPLRASSPTRLPKQPMNAFQLLMNPDKKLNEVTAKAFVDRAVIDAFVEGEAEESDDETPFGVGFGTSKGKDDEDDGEGADGEEEHVTDLVDDQEMDEKTQAKELVLEKAQEHAAEDDAKALKIAQDAVEGNFRNGRNKRRRGVDGPDDDTGSEDDETRGPKIEKKRRIKDDRLPEMAKNPETLAFYQAYKKGHDDDEEDGFVAGNSHASDIDMDDDNDDDDAEDEAVETITATEVRRQVREARKKADSSMLEFDPDNVEWIGLDPVADDDEDLDVEIVRSKPARAKGILNLDVDVEDEWRMRKSLTESSKEETKWWQGQHQESRSSSTRTNGRGAAVTGHDRQKKPPSAVEGSSRRTNLTKSASVLSSLNTKKVRGFE